MMVSGSCRSVVRSGFCRTKSIGTWMSFCRDHFQFATSILLGQLTFNSLMFLIALLLLLFLFNIFLLLAETLNIHPSLEMMAKVSLECSKSKYSGPLWCAKRSHNQGLTSHITHTITSDSMHHWPWPVFCRMLAHNDHLTRHWQCDNWAMCEPYLCHSPGCIISTF